MRRPRQRPAGRARPWHAFSRRPAGNPRTAHRPGLVDHRAQDLFDRCPPRCGGCWSSRAPTRAEPRVGMLLVPARSPGCEHRRDLGSARSARLRQPRCSVARCHRTGRPRDQSERARRVARPGHAAGHLERRHHRGAIYTGVARAARDWLVGFLRSRAPSNLGAPLATLPRMQEAVGAIDALARHQSPADRKRRRRARPRLRGGAGRIRPDQDNARAENAVQAVERALQTHRQSRPLPRQPARAPSARRVVFAHPHASARCRPSRRRTRGACFGVTISDRRIHWH